MHRCVPPTGRDVLYRLYAEISLLVRANWTVGTFSSNVGRLVQLLRDQPEGTMVSMDDERRRSGRSRGHSSKDSWCLSDC